MKFKTLPLAAALTLYAAAAWAAPLTIEECLTAAMENNPDLVAAKESVSAERATVGQAAAGGRPQLSAGSSYSRGGSGLSGANNSGNYSSNIGLEQSISDWGRRDVSIRRARLSTEAASADYRSTVETVIQDVYEAYYGLNRAAREHAVEQTRFDNFEKRLKWAQAYYEVGTKPKIEVTKAEADLAASKLAIVRTQSSMEQYRAELANAMGIPLMEITEVVDILDYQEWGIALDEAVERAMNERPELIAKQKRVDSARSNVTLQMKGLSPSLSASAGYTASGSSPFSDSEWTTKFSLSVPLSDGGLTRGKVEEAEALLRAAEAEMKSLSNSVTLEVRKAWEALRESKEALVSSLEAERSAKATLELAQGRYAAGVGDNLEISDAVDSYATASSNTVLALYGCKTAQLDLEKAMGGLRYE
ncbi:MAG: TolC family protein [Synergistaceae bacterium]|nr:TolC family protein [Synergistaceae bacterium]